jgi:hypothetical protein
MPAARMPRAVSAPLGQQVAGYLWRYDAGWSLLDGPIIVPGPGNAFIQGYTVYNCNHTRTLTYEADSIGAVYVGYWVTGPTVLDRQGHTCPS